jgi:hypothetical protein
MKSIKKLMAIVIAVAVTGTLSLTAFAADGDFGSAAVEEDKTYTLSEMLTYAIEDEYLAHAEYEKIIDTFGAQRPFTNIVKAEETHIAALEPLFAKYGVVLPANTAEDYTVVPSTLLDAFKAGVQAETSNIAMYGAFLKQELPDDIRSVFTALKNASENHLAAFENGVSRVEGSATDATGNQGRQSRGRH